MYAGRMIEEATTGELFSNPLHPYTRFLINSLPQFGDKGSRESVPGNPPSLLHPPGGCPFHPRCPLAFDPCDEQQPPFVEVVPKHRVACWRIGGG